MLLDTAKAAEFIGVRETWIRYKVFRKEIPYIKVGRLVRFEASQLQKWINDAIVYPRIDRLGKGGKNVN